MGVGVGFIVLACVNVAFTVNSLLSEDVSATVGTWAFWLRLAVGLGFLALGAGELRSRVAVDREGVHFTTLVRRRTYPWQDMSEVRTGRPMPFGNNFVYLLRDDAKQVELPNSAGHVRLLQRWHTAASSTR